MAGGTCPASSRGAFPNTGRGASGLRQPRSTSDWLTHDDFVWAGSRPDRKSYEFVAFADRVRHDYRANTDIHQSIFTNYIHPCTHLQNPLNPVQGQRYRNHTRANIWDNWSVVSTRDKNNQSWVIFNTTLSLKGDKLLDDLISTQKRKEKHKLDSNETTITFEFAWLKK